MPTQTSAFDFAVSHVLLEEGGLSDHPADPGGRTNFGVTQTTLDAVRSSYPELNLPLTVDRLFSHHAKEIYRRHYWAPIRGDELPVGVALWMLDTAVNHGPGRAIRMLQQALGVKVDGWIGAKTLAAARAADRRALLDEVSARRAHHYMLQDAIDDDFGLGWARRLFRTYSAASGLELRGGGAE